MQEHLREEGAKPLGFVGSGSIHANSSALAHSLRKILSLAPNWAERHSSSASALSALRDHAEAVGILVVFNGVVGNNTHRPLNPDEFQGFAIADPFAPLVFVNNADFKRARTFTFVHELAHLLLGAAFVGTT